MMPGLTNLIQGVTVLALLGIGGCAQFSPDGGMDLVQSRASAELGATATKIISQADAQTSGEHVERLLARPLSADSAVQVALLSNRGLQADYNALGVSEAAFVEAGLPPALTFSYGRLASGEELEVERRVIANILALLTLPSRKKIAQAEFEAARYKAVEATFRLAAETRRAFYTAVAARQTVGFLERARTSADASAELTRKLGETGAATKLDQARASAFYAEVSTQLAQARSRATTEREKLIRLLGLWGQQTDFKLPGSLPNLPSRIETANQIEAEAIRKRVDLIAARLELDATAKSLGLTEATRYVSALELAGVRNFERKVEDNVDKSYPTGFEMDIAIPIFDLGEVATRRARETYMQSVNRLIAKAIDARSEARSAYTAYRSAYDIYRQYQNKILPLQKTILEESLLQYNGMLIDVFDLLTTERESITSNIAAIEAKRDFFLAGVDFKTAIIGGGNGGNESGEGTNVASAGAGQAEH